jgi:hypothetical protein
MSGTKKGVTIMRDQHPTSDQLLDLVLAEPIDQDGPEAVGDVELVESGEFAAVRAHLSDCVACRVRFTRLQRAGEFEGPSESVLSHLIADSPVLTEDVRTFISTVSRDSVEPGEVWKVGVDDAVLVWVRRIVNRSTIDVIPLVFDTAMADNESILIAADRTPLAMPLAALTSIRIQIHADTFVNKIGNLDIAEPVEAVLAASRSAQPHRVEGVGLPIEDRDDPRIEYRQLINDILSDLTPVVYAERCKAEADQHITPAERVRRRIEAGTTPGADTSHVDSVDAGRVEDTDASSPATIHDFGAIFDKIQTDLIERLDPTALCHRCNELSEHTDHGQFTALLKVHYIDASVLVVLYEHDRQGLPEPWQAAIGVASMLQIEVDVHGVAVASQNNLDESILMTRADLRPALLLPHGTWSKATATITGHSLVETLMKFLDGEPAAWDLFERAETRLPEFDLETVARGHATTVLGEVRKSGSMSQPAKKQSWTNMNDEVIDVVSAFVAAARNSEVEAALNLLGLDDE